MEQNSLDIAPILTPQKIKGPVEALVQAWGLFRANAKIMILIAVLPAVFVQVGGILLEIRDIYITISAIVVSLSGFVMTIALQPALIDTIRRLHDASITKPLITFKEQYKIGFRYFWAIIFVMILQILLLMGATLFLFVPGIIVGVYCSMYIFTLVIDGKKGFSAFVESFGLIFGRWWAVFGRLVFLSIVVLAGYIVASGFALIISVVFGVEQYSPIYKIVYTITNLALGAVTVPLTTAYMYNIFISLKANKKQDVSTTTFKRSITVFFVIGVLFVLVLIGISGLVLIS